MGRIVAGALLVKLTLNLASYSVGQEHFTQSSYRGFSNFIFLCDLVLKHKSLCP